VERERERKLQVGRGMEDEVWFDRREGGRIKNE
jgi:hypothetical protein